MLWRSKHHLEMFGSVLFVRLFCLLIFPGWQRERLIEPCWVSSKVRKVVIHLVCKLSLGHERVASCFIGKVRDDHSLDDPVLFKMKAGYLNRG